MAIVYRHIRLDKNEPFYIGIGKTILRAKDKSKRSSAWKAVSSKGYRIEILFDDLTWEQALEKEKEFIKLYGRKKYGGILVNITEGGLGSEGLIHSEATKQKMKKSNTKEVREKKSIAKKGNKNPNFGKKWSEEKKQWMSEINKGRKFSEEQIENMRNSRIGKKHSEETKQKLKDSWEKNRIKRLESIQQGWITRKKNIITL